MTKIKVVTKRGCWCFAPPEESKKEKNGGAK